MSKTEIVGGVIVGFVTGSIIIWRMAILARRSKEVVLNKVPKGL